MRHAFTNCQILSDGALRTGSALLVDNGIIGGLIAQNEIPAESTTVDLNGARLVPGFIDLQVNGGNGVLFNDAPTVDTLCDIATIHYQYGTTSFLPTLISDDRATIRQGFEAVNEAIADKIPGIAGIHIEGPFLNVEKRGIHAENKIRRSDEEDIGTIQSIAGGSTLITIAPECVPADHIHALRQRGASICAGHTNATFEELTAAFELGVGGVTHLFNAMSPLVNRAPGAVGAALDHPDCWCCIIVDGRHVHPAALRIALRAKGGHRRFILVTDAMPTVGQIEKHFWLNDEEVQVVDGVCQNEYGTLAGSDLNMAQAIANAQSMLGVNFAEAIEMATAHPAQFLGISEQVGTLAVGKRANMVALGENGTVLSTWVDGEKVWG